MSRGLSWVVFQVLTVVGVKLGNNHSGGTVKYDHREVEKHQIVL